MKNYKCVHCNMFQCTVPDEISLDKCPICQASLQIDSMGDDWMGELYADEQYWYIDAFTEFPSILAHEYWRLREMFGAKQPYGVYFQIRDVMESVLKYEVLLACAWGCSVDVPEFKEKVVCHITSRNMSLGSWYELGKEILMFFKSNDAGNEKRQMQLPEVLIDALSGVISEYGDNSEFIKNHRKEYRLKYDKELQSMVSWRNEKIGHGALGFEEDEEFRADIICMIERFKNLFGKKENGQKFTVGEAIVQQKLWADDINLVGQELVDLGNGNAVHSLRVCNPEYKIDYDITPYIKIVDGHIFFFDNQKTEKRTQQQCYTNGQRKNVEEPYFTLLHKLNNAANLDNDVAAQTRIKEEDDLLNRLALAPNFTEPKFVVDWLKNKINRHDKAVLWIKMPRGSGKSTVAEKLNCLNSKPLILYDDLDVRTYHISRSQIINEEDFVRQIEEQWRHDFDGRTEWTGYKQIKDYILEGDAASEALAKYLNNCLEFTKSIRNKKRILMVIDGLDEILNDHLWEYLPNDEMLADGAFILLLSRDPNVEELPMKIINHLMRVPATESFVFSENEGGNRTFLAEYYKSHVDQKVRNLLRDSDVETMMQQAEYRVLYFSMLCKLVNSGLSVGYLPNVSILTQKYLEILKIQYGDKEYAKLCDILSVLCVVAQEEPLSLREITALTNEGTVSLDILSKINDIAPLINVQRGLYAYGRLYAGENRYALANEDIAESILKELPYLDATLNSIFISVCQYVRDVSDESLKNELPGLGTERSRFPFPVMKNDIAIVLSILPSLFSKLSNYQKHKIIESICMCYNDLITKIDGYIEWPKLQPIYQQKIYIRMLLSLVTILKEEENMECILARNATVVKLLDQEIMRDEDTDNYKEEILKSQLLVIEKGYPISPKLAWPSKMNKESKLNYTRKLITMVMESVTAYCCINPIGLARFLTNNIDEIINMAEEEEAQALIGKMLAIVDRLIQENQRIDDFTYTILIIILISKICQRRNTEISKHRSIALTWAKDELERMIRPDMDPIMRQYNRKRHSEAGLASSIYRVLEQTMYRDEHSFQRITWRQLYKDIITPYICERIIGETFRESEAIDLFTRGFHILNIESKIYSESESQRILEIIQKAEDSINASIMSLRDHQQKHDYFMIIQRIKSGLEYNEFINRLNNIMNDTPKSIDWDSVDESMDYYFDKLSSEDREQYAFDLRYDFHKISDLCRKMKENKVSEEEQKTNEIRLRRISERIERVYRSTQNEYVAFHMMSCIVLYTDDYDIKIRMYLHEIAKAQEKDREGKLLMHNEIGYLHLNIVRCAEDPTTIIEHVREMIENNKECERIGQRGISSEKINQAIEDRIEYFVQTGDENAIKLLRRL